jgi:transcriptional regulator with XRE-family HTH domain
MAKGLNTIGLRIDAIRQKHGLTLYRVAKNAGMDYAQFYRMMRGKGQPARESLIRICKALGCNVQEASEIFFDTNYRLPSSEELEEASQPAA